MWAHLEYKITQYARDSAVYDTQQLGTTAAVVIRRARDADAPLLRDLAALDSAEPLAGAVLVAVIDGRPSAALSLDDDRVIADPFCATVAAVELLRLRADQIRAAERRPQHWLRRRLMAHRARA